MSRWIFALTGASFVIGACASQSPEPPVMGAPPPPGPAPVTTAPAPAPTQPGATAPQPKLPLADLQKRFLSETAKAWTNHDAKALSRLYAEDVSFGYPAIGGWREAKSRAAIEANMADFWRAFPDAKVGHERGYVSKNVLVMQWIVNGTHSGDFMGLAATKKKIGYHGVSVIWFRDDGLVSREHMYYDDTSFLAQLGIAPKGVKGRPVAEIPSTEAEWLWGKGDDTENKNAELVKSVHGAFAKKDEKGFTALLADDVAYSDYMQPADTKGKRASINNFKNIVVAFPDIKLTPVNTWAAGDSVIVESEITGTFKAMYGYALPTKKTGTLHSLDVMQFKGGKLSRGWSYGSSGEFAWAFGLLPKESPKKEPAPPAAPAKPPASKPPAAKPPVMKGSGVQTPPAGPPKATAPPSAAPPKPTLTATPSAPPPVKPVPPKAPVAPAPKAPVPPTGP